MTTVAPRDNHWVSTMTLPREKNRKITRNEQLILRSKDNEFHIRSGSVLSSLQMHFMAFSAACLQSLRKKSTGLAVIATSHKAKTISVWASKISTKHQIKIKIILRLI